ncbi:hypothetical protein [Kiloniella laminariae]|nr:hypothetical protein [Kiloniella laminariae]
MRSVIIALALFGVSGVQVFADSSSPETPTYKGAVHIITEPIIMAVRSYSLSPTRNTSKTFGKVNGGDFYMGSFSKGTSQVKQLGDNLLMLVSIDEMTVNAHGQQQRSSPEMKISVELTPQGKVLEMDFAAPELSSAEFQQTKQLLGNAVKQSVATFPKEGVREGHRFENSIDLGIGIMKSVGKVLGKTEFRDREMLLVDFDESTASFNFEGKNIKGDITGYGLMDVATGAWSYSELLIDMLLEYEGEKTNLYVNQVTEILLE